MSPLLLKLFPVLAALASTLAAGTVAALLCGGPWWQGPRRRVPLSVGLMALWFLGGFALANRFANGLGAVTNLSDAFPWGLWKMNVLWGIALGAGGFLTAGIVYVFRLRVFEPVLRPAVLTAFLAYQCLGVGSLLIDLGRPYNIWHPIIYWQPHSLLFEISWCIIIYSVVLTVEFLPIVFERFGWEKADRWVHRVTVPFVIVGVIASTLHQSSLGGLFLIVPGKLSPLWYSPALPLFALVSALISGVGLLLAVSHFTRRIFGRSIPLEVVPLLARSLVAVIGVYLAGRLLDLTLRGAWPLAFENSFQGTMLLLELGLLCLPVAAFFANKDWGRESGSVLAGSMAAVGSVVLNRLNIAWFGMTRAGFYWPSWTEIVITLMLISVAIVLFGLAARYLPLYVSPEAPARRPAARFAAVLFALLAFAAAPSFAEGENDTCLACHTSAETGAPQIDHAGFSKSIHAKHLCVSCHADAAEIPHPEKPAPVSCAKCHRLESQIYLNSDHGRAMQRGRKEAATCKDCHGHSHVLLSSRDPGSPVNRRNIPHTCAKCHADPKRMEGAHLTERDPLGSYNHTVHGASFAAGRIDAAVCSDCHGTHDLHGSANPASKIFKKNIPETCGRCHQNVAAVYRESIHGQAVSQGIKEAPACTDCHGEHTIRSPRDAGSSVWRGAVTKTCSGCHESERVSLKFGLPTDRLATFLDTYHGMASQRGDLTVANCASCHGFHDVLPSTDPRASINRANLSQTCGKCHPGAGPKLSTGYVHGPPSQKHWLIGLAKKFYLIVIPFTILFMFGHNLLDWLRKSFGSAPPPAHDEDAVRLTVNERWQHAVLTASFTALAFSGFALKLRESGWMKYAAPFSEDARRGIHRWSAAVFCALALYHLGYVAFTRRGRLIVRELWPSPRDLRAAFQRLAYNLGLRAAPPPPSGHYEYPEKIEYWSLVWGSVVMVVTGGVLVFNNLMLKHFPLWLADVATIVHYYEAILACAAIIIWHLYGVIFDPDVYPMNLSWLIGRRRKKK